MCCTIGSRYLVVDIQSVQPKTIRRMILLHQFGLASVRVTPAPSHDAPPLDHSPFELLKVGRVPVDRAE